MRRDIDKPFLKENVSNYAEIHLKPAAATEHPENDKFVIWIRNPLARFVSAFNHSKAIIDFDISKLNGETPTLQNCQAPQKIKRKIERGYAFSHEYEELFKYFDNANALAESITSSNWGLKSRALELMQHPTEHIYKGIGWYLGNGYFIKMAKASIIKVGTIESIGDDINDLKQLLSIPLSQSLGHVRQNKSNLPTLPSLTTPAKKNLRNFLEDTDYSAIEELKACKLIPDHLYE